MKCLRVVVITIQVFSQDYFADITTFMAFNVMAVFGNFATEIVRFPGNQQLSALAYYKTY